jgi:hypothetical protein
MTRCVALFTGGLDSQLAVCLLQEQGIEVRGICCYSVFEDHRELATVAAGHLGIELTTLEATEEYFAAIRQPRFASNDGAAASLDRRIYWLRRVRQELEASGARFVITGDVLAQRLPEQSRSSLEMVDHHAGLADRILRPLSAQLLPETLPAGSGWVDRGRLLALQGRGRKEQLKLAARFGIEPIPPPLASCALSDNHLSGRVRDLVQHHSQTTAWDFELLLVGRHFRFAETKIVLGRHRAENDALAKFQQNAPRAAALLAPENFVGPTALVAFGSREASHSDPAIHFAAALVAQFAKRELPPEPAVAVHWRGAEPSVVAVEPSAAATAALPL